MTKNETLYRQLLGVFPDLVSWAKEAWNNDDVEFAVKFKSGGMMDLNLDLLNWEESSMRIALSHYYKHESGDMIPDPDMEVEVNTADEAARALSFQNIYLYQNVDEPGINADKLQRDLDSFLGDWLNNIRAMEYELEPEQNQEIEPEMK